MGTRQVEQHGPAVPRADVLLEGVFKKLDRRLRGDDSRFRGYFSAAVTMTSTL